MPRTFPAAADKAALVEAVKAVEARSSAEVIVVVRKHSGSYLHADLLLGIAFGCATLWFLLFAPWEFLLPEILVGPLAVGTLVGLVCSHAPGLRRLLTRQAARRERVLTAARASFVEKGVGRTSGRTGLVVYLSLLEQAAEVVADSGVLDRVPAERWTRATREVDAAIRRGLDGALIARSIRALADVLEPVLPHAADDVNELPDGIEA
jgi:putative membrane protein